MVRELVEEARVRPGSVAHSPRMNVTLPYAVPASII